MQRFFFTLFLLLVFTTSRGAGFEYTENCKLAYDQMLQLNFNTATNYLNKEKTANPHNAAIQFIGHYIDFLRAFLSEENGDYDLLKNNLDKRITTIETEAAGTPWMNMAKGEMLMQMALIKLKRKEYITAGYYIRKSFKLLEENQKTYPNFTPNLKPLGFFHAIIGAVPENYKWLSNLVGLSGTIAQGGGELTSLINKLEGNRNLVFIRTEASFLKIFIATHLEKNYKEAFKILENTKKFTPLDNPMLVFLEANTNLLAGIPSAGLALLNAYQETKVQYPFHYLYFLRGTMTLNTLDLHAAADLNRFTSGFKGKSFIRSAYYKLALISFLNNDTTEFRNYLAKVKTKGDDFTDEDKQALKEAQSGEFPNVSLLRSRLLFDGGNYNAALTELSGKREGYYSKYKDQLEYTYRLARIFDKKGQTDKAIQYYSITYENGKRAEYYFAANAALNNGLIYETQRDNKNAELWYGRCLELRNHEYQNSIDHKAEAGLNRMGKQK